MQNIFQNNIWCYLINKIELEIKRLKKLKDPDNEYVIMDLEQEKKELKKNKAASSQAGGPAHKESGSKRVKNKPQLLDINYSRE